MCSLCEANDGFYQSCQDCGTLICLDISPDNGVGDLDRAYTTESGDVYCASCGREHDAAAREIELMEDPDGTELGDRLTEANAEIESLKLRIVELEQTQESQKENPE